MKPILNKTRKWSPIRLILILALIGWMALIYIKSNQPYQAQDIKPFLSAWFPESSVHHWLPHWTFYYGGDLVSWQNPYVLIEFFIRKSAHVTEYGILTLLWLLTLHSMFLKRRMLFTLTAIMVILYAASDEWHQSFVAGRTGHAIDVAVDAIGLLIVTCVWFGIAWMHNKKGAAAYDHKP